jgi:hypothetical protein
VYLQPQKGRHPETDACLFAVMEFTKNPVLKNYSLNFRFRILLKVPD